VRNTAFDNNKTISLTIRFIILFVATVLLFTLSGYRAEYVAHSEEWTVDNAITALSDRYNVNEADARSIIGCESEFKANAFHVNKDHSVDYGYWQINTFYHIKTAKKLGLDIFTPQGNLEYGFYLLSQAGVAPWSASNTCHKLVR